MSLLKLFRDVEAKAGSNGNSASIAPPIVDERVDLALRFFNHVLAALDILNEARQHDVEARADMGKGVAADEKDDKKVN
jgi:hypothetical protein